MAAERLGFSGSGGGGTAWEASRFRSVRCVSFRALSSASRDGIEGSVLETALVAGSRCSGRSVNVSSMVVVVGGFGERDGFGKGR